MPAKDHLGTREESDRRRNRNIKKINAITYQGAPPTLTDNITNTGLQSKTEGQIKNVSFPILYPIDDESGNVAAVLNVDLGLEEAHYHQIQLSDNGGAVVAITINFVNLSKNRVVNFFLDFIKDPANVALPTVTFNPPLEGLPAGFPITDARYLLNIIAKDTPVETRFEVVSGGSGGAAAITTWVKPVRVTPDGFNAFFPNTQEIVDGVTLVPGDRILQKDELLPQNNGLFDVVGPIIPGVPNQYLLVRADFASLQPIPSEVFTAVEEGTANTKKLYHLTNPNPIIVTTDPQTWEEFTSGGAGGLADPIILNENDIGTIGFANVLIDWSTHNFHRMKLNGDVSITMQNLPVAGKWEQVIVEFTQDVVGGHSVTFLDTFSNAVIPTINPGANSITTVVFYAYNSGNSVILAFDVLGNFGSTGTEYGHFTKVANQPPPLTVGTPALFDSIIQNNGITIDTAGRISGLRAGHIYECECFIAITNAISNTAALNFKFFDVANTTLIGSMGDAILTGMLATDSVQPSARAMFTALANTDTLEVHFVNNNDLVNSFMYGVGVLGTPQSYIMIKDVTGFLGGAGTVINFPNVLINDVETITNPSAALNIDLTLSQHYVIELDKNIVITFINVPPDIDTSEQIVLEFIQDVTGGRTVGYTDSIDPSIPAISTASTAREVVTGFIRRENAGTYVFNLYLVGN